MNTWKKVGDAWCVYLETAVAAYPGKQVVVTNRAGVSKTVTLGEKVSAFVYKVAPTPRAPIETQAVGDLGGVLALFAKAKANLKFPAIVLSVPEANLTLRLSVAGPRAKVPGSITVLENEKSYSFSNGGEPQRDWLGRILVDGTYQPSRSANGRTEAIVKRLSAFAAEPAKVAAEHGRLTGSCCFCNRALTDERSTAVGYGATCADNYGLPWGLKAEAV